MKDSVPNRSPGARWVRAIELAGHVSVICIAIVLLWQIFRPTVQRTSKLPALPASPLLLKGANTKGSPEARVGMVVFSDFQCPACRQFAQSVLPDLMKRYVELGQLVIAFRHLPIEAIHPLAFGAARAAQCAGAQGRFWPVHDFLFNNPDAVEPRDVRQKSPELGLNAELFDACLSDPPDDQIRSDLELSKTLGVSATPTMFFGPVMSTDGASAVKATIVISGVKPPAVFRTVMDKILADTATGNSAK